MDEPARLPPERERRLRDYLALLRRSHEQDVAETIEAILWAPIVKLEDR